MSVGLIQSEVSKKMNELYAFVQDLVGAEDGSGADMYNENIEPIQSALVDYFAGYMNSELAFQQNHPPMRTDVQGSLEIGKSNAFESVWSSLKG